MHVVKFGDAEHHTMGDYGADFNDELQEDEQDIWKDEQEFTLQVWTKHCGVTMT